MPAPGIRVTAGSAKGLILRIPSRPKTRPTSGRVREAIFSSIGNRRFGSVADLFAGSGILGIEALSRGAASVTFVESNRTAVTVIRANLEKSKFADRSLVIVRTVESMLREAEPEFDLVLADPPYDYADLDGLVTGVADSLLRPEGILVFEHASRRGPPAACPGLTLSKTRTHGDSAFSIFVKT